jgi:hypothetical protein
MPSKYPSYIWCAACVTEVWLITSRIQNPLHGKTKEALFADVTAFCHEYGFVDQLETFKKGALLAQDSSKLEHYSELSEEDKEVIRAEKARKWSICLSKTFSVC